MMWLNGAIADCAYRSYSPKPALKPRPMPDLRILSLGPRQLSQAYPLVRSGARVTAERWEALACELIAAGGGILAVQADDSCLHGVAAFRQLGSLGHEQILQVEIVVAFELSGDAPVRRMLCAGLEERARELGCRSIVFTSRQEPE